MEKRNKLDNLCYTLEKTLGESKDKLPAADVATLEGLIKEGRAAVEKQDDAAITAAVEKLEKEAHRVASVMYQAAGAGAGNGGPTPGDGAPPPDAPPPGASNGKKKDVIDAEFEESP